MKLLDFIYKRYKPENKLRLISEMSDAELDAVTEPQIQLLLRDARERDVSWKNVNGEWVCLNTRRGKLTFDRNLTPGNEHNSYVEYVYENKNHHIEFNLYIQGEDIDTNCSISFDNAKNNRLWGSLHEEFNNGYSHEIPAFYDSVDYRNVIRCILYQSVLTKYHLKFDDYFTGTTTGYRHEPLKLREEYQTNNPYKNYTIYGTETIIRKIEVSAKTKKDAIDMAKSNSNAWELVNSDITYKAEKDGNQGHSE